MSLLPLRVDTRSPTPIWSQIEDGVRHLVAVGQLAPGSAVPSVRDLARDLRINPATVSKAYQRLTDVGVLDVRRGDGTYVATDPPSITRADRNRILRDGARRFVGLALTLGLSRKEAAAELDAAWTEADSHHKRSER
jgi:GntR family transcriptional regulator